MTDERAKEFLECLGNGKTIYEIESEEYWDNLNKNQGGKKNDKRT